MTTPGDDGTIDPSVWAARAVRHNDVGEFEAAASAAERAIGLGARGAAPHISLGWALENLDRDPEARVEYELALRAEPENIDAAEGLGNVLHRLGERDAAAEYFRLVTEAASGISDPDAATLEVLGWSQFRLGHLDEAVHTLRTALTLEPGRAAARFDLGLALLLGEQPDRAEKEYERALADLQGWEPGRREAAVGVASFDLREYLRDGASAGWAMRGEDILALLEDARSGSVGGG
ncbi:MAG TPA: tetratricopeptide repeat protein [Actinomycetota bacterium]